MNHQATEFESTNLESPTSQNPVIPYITILKETRAWGITLLIFGILSLFASSFLNAPWGVLLIIVGLASFYFRSSAMMVVYGVTLAWAGVINATSGQVFWIGFAIFQWFLTFRIFQKFVKFRSAEVFFGEQEASTNELISKRAAGAFPWAASALGTLSLLGLGSILFGVIFFVIITNSETVPEFVYFLESLFVNFGVLGFAFGLSSLLCKYSKKAVAIVGMVAGILTLVIEIVLLFI